MRRSSGITTPLAVLTFAVAKAAAPPSAMAREAADMAELNRLEAAWNQAHLRGDATALDRIFADDIVIAVPNMAAMTKADALGVFRSGKMHFDTYATSNMRTRLYGDAAVVTGRLQRHRDMGGRAVDDDWQFTKVYIRRPAGWQLVSFHASPYAE